MKNLWNTMIGVMEGSVAERRAEAEEVLYDCGDGVWLRIFAEVSDAEADQLTSELRARFAKETVKERTLCGNRFLGVTVGDGYLWAIYIPSRKELRLLYTEHGRLIPDQLGEKPCYAGSQRITQITPNAEVVNFGMCYILALGEGHFLVYDGLGSAGEDEVKLWETLEADTPKGQKPVIDAWILTHPHYDHIAGVQKFAARYGDAVEVRNFVMNMANPHTFPVRLWKEVSDCYATWLPGIRAAYPNAPFWKVHTGERFFVGQAEVEVLLTQEEIYPDEMLVNDSSLVTRVMLNGKKLFFPADVQSDAPCLLLHKMYGAYLKSDYYQIAHHAWDTEALRFYGDVDPQTLFWPLRRKDWGNPACRMWGFPATVVMKRELDEGKRRFLIAMDENITEPLC